SWAIDPQRIRDHHDPGREPRGLTPQLSPNGAAVPCGVRARLLDRRTRGHAGGRRAGARRARGRRASTGDAHRAGDPAPPGARRLRPARRDGSLVRGPSGRALDLMCCTVAGGVLVDIVTIAHPVRLSGRYPTGEGLWGTGLPGRGMALGAVAH